MICEFDQTHRSLYFSTVCPQSVFFLCVFFFRAGRASVNCRRPLDKLRKIQTAPLQREDFY